MGWYVSKESEMNDTRIVNAIQARISGVWDDPDLLSVGPLQTDEAKDIVQILSMRDRTPGNTTVEEFTEFMEADSLQGCRESDRIAEGLDEMGKPAEDKGICEMCGVKHNYVYPDAGYPKPTFTRHFLKEPPTFADIEAHGAAIRKHGHTNQTETIDITPAGLQTPEGRELVNRAMAHLDDCNRVVADLATEMIDTHARNEQYPSAKLDILKAAIESRRSSQNVLLYVVSGR